MTAENAFRRPIRSFVRRESRITASQRRALEELWPRFGVPFGDTLLDLDALFKRSRPRVLEIGFGNGDALMAMACANPEVDYLGVDVHRPGAGQLLRQLDARSIGNIRVCCDDAKDLLARIPDGALAEACLFFPDPWPKKRHHKRRLVQPEWVESVRQKLVPNGLLFLATDWQDYATHMLSVLSAAPGFTNVAGADAYAPRPSQRPLTKFERRGQRLGHAVYDLAFRRIA
jgi:tRNA (guanine-N7-)-methyltransferase